MKENTVISDQLTAFSVFIVASVCLTCSFNIPFTAAFSINMSLINMEQSNFTVIQAIRIEWNMKKDTAREIAESREFGSYYNSAQQSLFFSLQEFESEYQELWDWLMDMDAMVTDSHQLMMSEEQRHHLFKVRHAYFDRKALSFPLLCLTSGFMGNSSWPQVCLGILTSQRFMLLSRRLFFGPN